MRPGVRLLTAALWIASRAQAADPQPYTLTMQGTGIAALDATLHASSQLESLRKSAPVGPFALIGRAQQDVERLQTVLESFGYYRRSLTVTVNGQAFDDPGLPDTIAALTTDRPAKVDIAIELGPLYHLRRITIDGEISAAARTAMKLQTGAPAVAAEVLAARDRLLNTLEEEGHALAKVDDPVAYEDQSEPVLDVGFKVAAGPQVDVGEIRLTGLKRMHVEFVRRRLLLHSGERYRPSLIERARTDLLALGVFSGVTVHTATEVDAQGRLPVTFELQERPRHAVTLNAAYSSDLGGSVGTTWSDRNVFGNAEQLNLTASAINLGGNATTGLGYDFAAQLIKPDFLRRDQSLQFTLAALKEDLIAYQQTAATGGVSLNRKLSPVWNVSVGLNLEQEHILQEGEACLAPPPLPAAPALAAALAYRCMKVPRDYTLVAVPISAKYDSTSLINPLDDPLHGLRATLTITPTESLGNGNTAATVTQSLSNGHASVTPSASTGNGNATFVIVQATASTYFDLEKLGWTQHGRSVIALRALGGLATGAGEFSLPPDQRFYGGGSLTVRGFPYQSVGPQFLDSNPIGGTAIEAVGAEFRQRFGEHFGTVFFVDAGEVTATTRPFQGTASIGYGTGLRYYTPIGPIRLDVGFPTRRPPGGIPIVEVYVGLGQVF
jgi:translocation and assembly module TamA